MARVGAKQLLVPSLLDRLIDNDPHLMVDVDQSRAQIIRDLKTSVRRDLENLLNTHLPWPTWHAGYEELEKSVLNYGLADFSAMAITSEDQQRSFSHHVEEVVQRFETRLRNVSVDLVENEDSADRSLKLKIRALLYVEPELEPIAFQSMLEPASQAVIIEEDYYDG